MAARAPCTVRKRVEHSVVCHRCLLATSCPHPHTLLLIANIMASDVCIRALSYGLGLGNEVSQVRVWRSC